MKNFNLGLICACMSMIPWGLLLTPFGLYVQMIGLTVQIIGLAIMVIYRKSIF